MCDSGIIRNPDTLFYQTNSPHPTPGRSTGRPGLVVALCRLCCAPTRWRGLTLRAREGRLESFLAGADVPLFRMYPLRLLAFLGPYKRRAVLAFLCVIASGGAVIAMPQIIRWAIDYGLGPEKQNGELVATGEKHLLLVAAVAIVGAAVFRGVFDYGQTYLGEWISQKVAYDIRNRIYDRFQRLSYAYHDNQ